MINNWKDMFTKENRYYETDNGILYRGNCLDIMDKIPNECIDLVLTDPPYLIEYKTNRSKDKNNQFTKIIDNDNNPEILNFIPIIHQKLKNNRAVYIFGSWKTVDKFKPLIEHYFTLKNIITWVKNNWTAGDLKAQFGQQYEFIFYANKGRAFINSKRYSDVWNFKRVSDKNQYHQNQKPLDLIERILECHSDKNSIVLDPFIGSGSTAVACEKLNRRWIGIELNNDYCEITKNRLSNIQKSLNL